eukprot:TRINITY_DN1056_c0_g1_i4.p1 TRINITY_DN1056_c0_g1~~TRINITY_DN1056_c0_g1_i4.p1  ORF type:complete len:231 (-),score=48.43 TRINITY_DN1056_c0_g1_i4:43-735(-)
MRIAGEDLPQFDWPHNQDPENEMFNVLMQSYIVLYETSVKALKVLEEVSDGSFCDFLIDIDELESDDYSPSMMRVHKYTTNPVLNYTKPHYDLGLLSVAPRGSVPGLMIRDFANPTVYTCIEDKMDDNDLIVFSSSTLSIISKKKYRPIIHMPHANPQSERLSLVFFLRTDRDKPHPFFDENTAPTPLTYGSNVTGKQIQDIIRKRREIYTSRSSFLRKIYTFQTNQSQQ